MRSFKAFLSSVILAAQAAYVPSAVRAETVSFDWDSLAGHYVDRDCEVEISEQPGGIFARPHYTIYVTDGDESLVFTARVEEFQRSLIEGHHAAGTAATVDRVTGFPFGRHTSSYGSLRFSQPDESHENWWLRGVTLDRTVVDFNIVVESTQVGCWNLVKQ